jgi:protein tyrosine/serine phosphatase
MARWPLAAVFTAVLALLVASATGCSKRPGAAVAGIDNFAEVTAGPHGLYRGAQPSEEGFRTLRGMGVRTVVNLRDDADPREQAWAEAAGMQYVRIPSMCRDPRADDVRRFLRLMEGGTVASQGGPPASFPVFVHCLKGKDRTGLFVAAYRIVEQHWSSERALREMDDFGHSAEDCPELDPFVKQLDPAAYDAGAWH